MENLIIRKAKLDDLPAIQELNYQLFLQDEIYDPLLNMRWPFETEGKEYFTNRISGKEGVCFVAECDKRIIGYLAGALVKPYSYRTVKKQSELENTLVEEAFRGKRVGEKLFQTFMQWSKEQGAERIKVSTSADNLNAIKFYQRVGFVPYATELEYEL